MDWREIIVCLVMLLPIAGGLYICLQDCCKYFYKIDETNAIGKMIKESVLMQETWRKQDKELSTLLGIETICNNVAAEPERLMMINPRKEDKEQFHPKAWGEQYYVAKEDSLLNQQYVSFCRDKNLECNAISMHKLVSVVGFFLQGNEVYISLKTTRKSRILVEGLVEMKRKEYYNMLIATRKEEGVCV